MKKIRIDDLDFISAGHEQQNLPGVVKKILFTKDDFSPHGHIQMINWAKLPVGNSFISHYHEDMDEVFIILTGIAKIRVGDKEELIGKMEAVLIPSKIDHSMENIGNEDMYYIVIGSATGTNGKTI